MTQTIITSLGNAGFQVTRGQTCILIDPLFRGLPGKAASPCAGTHGTSMTGLILITHDHWDHFNADDVAQVVGRTGAVVIGPQNVVRKLSALVPAASLIELEPAAFGQSEKGAGMSTRTADMAITAFRTCHGEGHNSYLVELPGLRFFHDGDNERTQCLDRSLLKNLDALMMCPWQGSDWVEFIDTLKPRYWFVMHLTEDELDAHERGEFFPDFCDHVPAGLVALRPGGSMVLEER